MGLFSLPFWVKLILPLALSSLLALLLSKRISSPFQALYDFLLDLAAGKRGARIELASSVPTPLALLGNTAASKSEALEEALAREKAAFQSLVSAMREGFLLLSGEGKILLFNQSFQELTGLEKIAGLSYWQALAEPSFIQVVRTALDQKKQAFGEVKLPQKTLLVSAAFVPFEDQVVVLLHDASLLRGLEKIKRELVVNISHELKTPLTAIRGYLETLEEELADPAKSYLAIVRRHTDRLMAIVRDLLLLSELEEGKATLSETVDLTESLFQILPLFEKRCREKNLYLKCELPSAPLLLLGDPFKLEQLLVNLLDNAVKYTEQGGITVRAEKRERELLLSVQDTGVGIPEEHHSRLFERFYVVDKSRSRRTGGTGLGLSIVRHIALLHGGSVQFESRPAQGTTFLVTLPLDKSKEKS